MDPDSQNIYTKSKIQSKTNEDSPNDSGRGQPSSLLNFPSDGWTTDLRRMPFFSRAEMNLHIAKSGKNIDPSKITSVPTSVRKATTFLNDEYLKDIKATSDMNFFFLKAQCYHSFRKSDPPHNLKLVISLENSEVKHASCSCVAGKVGFCNHVLALMLKICKFCL